MLEIYHLSNKVTNSIVNTKAINEKTKRETKQIDKESFYFQITIKEDFDVLWAGSL